jgi:hypothetical protein
MKDFSKERNVGTVSFTLKASFQEAGELAHQPVLVQIETLIRLAIEQRIYWGEAGNEARVPEDSVLRRFVFRDHEPHPDFAISGGAEIGRDPTQDRVVFAFQATGNPVLIGALSELARRTGNIETVPW